jgi:hypothetical protein
MGDAELLLYSRGLEGFSLAAISRVVGRLSTTKREEYEPKIPELADLIDMVRVEARKDHPFVACGNCLNGMEIIEREGHRFAQDCTCRKEWRHRRDNANN